MEEFSERARIWKKDFDPQRKRLWQDPGRGSYGRVIKLHRLRCEIHTLLISVEDHLYDDIK